MNSTAFMENLRQLFAECDTDQNGSLGRQEFSELCSKIGLNKEAAAETFDRLDADKDNKITFDEFAAGFNQYKQTSSPATATATVVSAANGSIAGSSQPQALPPKTVSTDSHSSAITSGPNSQPSTPRPAARSQHQRLTPSPVSSARTKKCASPIGVMSLGSAGSSGNLTYSLRSANSGAGCDISAQSSSSVDISSCGGDPIHKDNSGVVIYSSDMINNDYEQASGSGQFGSMLSSSSSYSQLKTMQDLMECVQKLQNENQILTQIFFKDKREREEYISQLGEEFDHQLKDVEQRANRRVREELENEKRRLQEMMQAERETLQHHYQTLEKMSKLVRSSNGKIEDDEIDKVRSKLEDTFLENRQLKRSLQDTKTDVALIWKEMEKLKKQYEDKLSSAYEKHNETRNECDHIKQQLNLMKDSNRKLQDASDVITNYITDKVDPVIKVAGCNYEAGDDPNFLSPNMGTSVTLNGGSSRFGLVSPTNSRRGSILSEYINGNQSNSTDEGNNASSAGDLESLASSQTGSRPVRLDEECSNEKWVSTNGVHSTSSKLKDNHSDKKISTSDGQITRSESNTSTKSKNDVVTKKVRYNPTDFISYKTQIVYYNEKLINKSLSKIDKQSIIKQTKSNGEQQEYLQTNLRNIGRHFLIGTRGQSDTKTKNSKTETGTTKLTEVKPISGDDANEPVVEPADGPSKKTFNIILVGDSFVGKTSFAARFMEGSFVQGLISNCSIDFKRKDYKVDGVNYTVNLWDTA